MKFISLLTSIFFVSGHLSQDCYNPYQRKEIRDLTQDELTRFVNAAKKIQSTNSGNGNLTIYDNYSKTHYDASGNAHGTPKFLPWHRYYIRLYEKELQKIDSSVHLPYWDWSKDYDYPANSIVLSDSYMGGNGDTFNNYCLNSGKFSGLYINYPKLHCLQRNYNQGSSISSFTDPNVLNSYLNYGQFSDFCINLEEKHGDPHVNIGGGYDFRQMYSPNDPLFMLHHTFIDMLWYEWQQRHPDSNQFEGDAYGQTASPSDSLVTWEVTVQSTLNTLDPFFCYTYPRYQSSLNVNTNSPDTTQNLSRRANEKGNGNGNGNGNAYGLGNGNGHGVGLQRLLENVKKSNPDQAIDLLSSNLPSLGLTLGSSGAPGRIKKRLPLPDDWIKMNNLNIDKVRKNEARDNKFIDLLNAISDTSL